MTPLKSPAQPTAASSARGGATEGSPEGQGARRSYHHGDLEQALLATATEHVHAFGAQDVSLRKIAQAVGTSPSAAYSHFPDKNALLVAVAQVGVHELDEAMQKSSRVVMGSDDAAAVARFWGAGEAYIDYAVARPHMFRHIFGPICAMFKEGHHPPTEGDAESYAVLVRALDDLDARGLLRPGTRHGLDLVAWTMVHGFASLVLDGFMPPEVAKLQLFPAFARLALTDEASRLDPTGYSAPSSPS